MFSRYFFIGIINTIIHWFVFVMLACFAGFSQAVANLGGFLFAVSFSFFANARYTFNAKASVQRYVSFVLFMGLLSYATGFLADRLTIQPVVTLVVFSAISLSLGFLYSKIFVFRENR